MAERIALHSRIALAALATACITAAALPAVPALGQASGDCFEDAGDRNGSSVSRRGPHAIGPGTATDLVSDHDGVTIQVAVIRPEVAPETKVPVIVFATPYMGQDLQQGCHGLGFDDLVYNFVPHGYAVAVVAVRGTANSGGCSDLMGPAERADLDQAIRWFGTQPWSTGDVGMIGVSYDGSTPWEVAATGNPHLKTVVPISGVNDLYALMYGRGVNELRGAVVLNALYWMYGWVYGNPVFGNRSAGHTAAGFLCPEAVRGFAAATESSLQGERDGAAYWAARNSRPGVEARYRGSILLARGLQDWNVDPSHDYPWVTELERRGLVVQHLLGQWGHAWPDRHDDDAEREDWADLLLARWDRWLKHDGTADTGPRAQVQDSSGRWREEESWPPARAVERRLYLTPDGALSDSPPAERATVLLRPDARNQLGELACPSCNEFVLETTRELRLTGIPHLGLTVTPQGPGGHIGAWLFGGPGRGRLIGWGQVDLRFPQGGETATPPTPGQPLVVRLPLEPLDAVVPAGERLRLVLSQSWYGDHVPSAPTYPVEVELGATAVFSFPTLEVEPCRFFDPPRGAEPPAGRAGRTQRSRPGRRLRPRRSSGTDPARPGLRAVPARGSCAPPQLNQQPTPVVRPPTDRRPHAALSRFGRRIRGTLRLVRGTAADDHRVVRVEVALARTAGGRCAYLRRDGRLGRPGPCQTARGLLPAAGTNRWQLRLRRRLPRGRYVLTVRSVDSAGQVSRPVVRRLRVS